MKAAIDLWFYLMLRSQRDPWSVRGRLFAVWHSCFHLRAFNSLCVTFRTSASSIMHYSPAPPNDEQWSVRHVLATRVHLSWILRHRSSAEAERSAANSEWGCWKTGLIKSKWTGHGAPLTSKCKPMDMFLSNCHEICVISQFYNKQVRSWYLCCTDI